MAESYDRTSEDLSNFVRIGHINLDVADQQLAHAYYVSGLGLTRDPYARTGVDNMEINVGYSEFHLPVGSPSLLRGPVGIVMPNRPKLLERLSGVRKFLKESRFSFEEREDHVEATCPWGNRMRIYESTPRFSPMWLGIPYIEFAVPVGTADAIARFYQQILLARASVTKETGLSLASVQMGEAQRFLFRETDEDIPRYDGHHIQIYAAQFSTPYGRLRELGLITREDSRYLYRFENIKDLETGKVIYSIHHEIRSMTHPNFMRPLVNRNPTVDQFDYAAGLNNDAWTGPPWRQPT